MGPPAAQAASVVPFPAAVDDAVDEDAVNPTLENRRQSEPVERKLQDEAVAPLELLDLRCDIAGQPAIGHRMALLDVVADMLRIQWVREVVGSCHGVESHGQKVGHFVARGGQGL